MIQDLHMLKEKNSKNCVYSSMLSPFIKMDKGYSFGDLEKKDKRISSFELFSNSTPLIKGKKASYLEAIQEAKKIIKFEKSIHIDGLSTDLQSMYKIIDFAERYKSSIDHMCADELNIFFSVFQKHGGSLVSFNELKNRADFIIVIGAKKENFSSYFFRDLKWNKQKIKRTFFYLDDQKFDQNSSFCSNKIDEVNYITTMVQILGTPHYMSPEQGEGGDIDARTDLYALGVLFYELLTGDKPYSAATAAALIYQHIHAPIPRLPRKLSQYQDIVDQLLAKRPEDRFQSARDVINELEKFQ